jgi:hypothetical protein
LSRRNKEGMSMVVDDGSGVNGFDQAVHFGGNGRQGSGRSQVKSCTPKVTPGASIDPVIPHPRLRAADGCYQHG